MSALNYPVFGTVFGGAGTHTSGIPLAQRDVDNTVERQKFTNDGTVTGHLEHHVTRAQGKHVSVSERHAYSSLEPMRTVTERKVFSPDDWNIFNASGVAVGASAGTTDTDVTPSGVGTN